MKETADSLDKITKRGNCSSLLLLVLCAPVLQSCATDFTVTDRVPGKVLAIKSLGFRETSDKISLQEVDPYRVRVIRNVCNTEALSVERQALLETKHGTQTFDCRDTYIEYLAHNVTTLGVPLLYDSVTGFKRVKEKCIKKPPVYRTVVTESQEIISEEAYDTNTTVCKELPVADVALTAKIDDAVITITTAADGIAALPPEKVAQLEQAAANADIKFKYRETELTTRHLRKKPEYPLLFSAAMNDFAADGEVIQGEEAPAVEISDPETALEQSFVAALAPSPPAPLTTPAAFQGSRQAVPVAKKVASGEKVTAKGGPAGGGKSSAPVFPLPPAEPESPPTVAAAESKAAPVQDNIAAAAAPPPAPEPVTGKPAAEKKAVPAPEKTAAAKSPSPAKIPPADAEANNSLAALPSAATGPRHPREIILFYDPYAPAPEIKAVAQAPLITKINQAAAVKKGRRQMTAGSSASVQADKSSGNESKSGTTAALKQKNVPARSGAETKQEALKADIILQQLLILNPALSKVCCPLTDKLFWKIRR